MQISMPTQLAQVPTAHRPPEKMEKAAQEFEAVLLGPLLESLQKTFSAIGEGGALGSGDYSFMSAQALASGMSEGGGMGIARLILNNLERTKVPTTR